MSENILDKIAAATRARYESIIKSKPLASVKAGALAMPQGGFEFEKALKSRVFPIFAR